MAGIGGMPSPGMGGPGAQPSPEEIEKGMKLAETEMEFKVEMFNKYATGPLVFPELAAHVHVQYAHGML